MGEPSGMSRPVKAAHARNASRLPGESRRSTRQCYCYPVLSQAVVGSSVGYHGVNSHGDRSMDDWIEPEPLHRAAEDGDLPAIQTLIESGCPINAFDEFGKTPLHYAILREDFAVVDYLLRHGSDINAHDERVIGNTPLLEAIGKCSLRMARLLIESGADPMIRGWMQRSALDRAKDRKKNDGAGSVGQALYDLLREAAKKSKKRR